MTGSQKEVVRNNRSCILETYMVDRRLNLGLLPERSQEDKRKIGILACEELKNHANRKSHLPLLINTLLLAVSIVHYMTWEPYPTCEIFSFDRQSRE